MSYPALEIRAFVHIMFRRFERWQAFAWPTPAVAAVPAMATPIALDQAQRIRAGRLLARGATVHEVAQRVGAHWTTIARFRRRPRS